VGSRSSGARRLEVPLNLVAYDNEVEAIRQFLNRVDQTARPNVIPVNDGPFASVAIIRALRRGEAVAMLADRTRGEETIAVTLLGQPVRLPAGPFRVAAVAKAPVVITFGAREGAKTVAFRAIPTADMANVPRAERAAAIQKLADQFAAELDAFLADHPYQWFNFYDFWGT
jgi:predicted LPLAT superfamily acyltransferase